MNTGIRWGLLLLVLLVGIGSVGAQTSLDERGYRAYVPASYSGEPLPLVIALHGFGDTADNFARTTDLAGAANAYGFVVAFPNGHLRQWNDGSIGDHYEDDTAILLDLIEVIAAEIAVDRHRIYLVGFSNGATMTYRAFCEAPEVFAGIAAVGGTMRRAQGCSSQARTSVLVLHGTGDTVAPFEGGNGRYSAPETVARWAGVNRCTDDDVPDYSDALFTGDVAVQLYDECAEGHLVMLYAIDGLPHVWPGAFERANRLPVSPYLDANTIIWAFFEMAYESEQAAQAAAAEATPDVTPEATDAPDG